MFLNGLNGLLPSSRWVRVYTNYTPSPSQAVRNGPNWDKTLLVVTYDDFGGFYDHVVPPPAPNDESPCNVWNAQVQKTPY